MVLQIKTIFYQDWQLLPTEESRPE